MIPPKFYLETSNETLYYIAPWFYIEPFKWIPPKLDDGFTIVRFIEACIKKSISSAT